MGRFQQAAGYQKDIGELYETQEVGNLRNAMEAYEIAAGWYATEDAITLAHGCMLKEATIAGELKEYAIAIKQLELIARASADNQLMKWSLKEYLLKAGLCHLATNNLLKAVEDGDVARFTDHIVEFDRYSKLDGWKTKILLDVKSTIGEDVGLL
ncbi:vesicular-fusion protein S17 [Podila horticola]|nr:vesicular-fusion protein S17 [Podila horticola]